MCYAEFNDVIEAIGRLDADVIFVEVWRSKMVLLDAFEQYPRDIGPGMYDIHSPNIPSQVEMESLISKATRVVPIEPLWINPDCGLKTRQWDEVMPDLRTMTDAAQIVSQRQGGEKTSHT